MDKKYVVTGPNGYIASRLIAYLKLHGYMNITVVQRKGTVPAGVSVVYYDGTAESLAVPEIQEADVIFHLAALYSTKTDRQTEIELCNSNILFSTHLLKNCNKAFVSASTFSAFNSEGDYFPSTLYAATKYAVEQIAELAACATGFLRLGDTYGPNDSRNKVYSLIQKGIETLNSPASQAINLTHVEDVCRGLVCLSHMVFEDYLAQVNNCRKFDFFYPQNAITLGQLAAFLNSAVKFGCSPSTELPPQLKVMPDFKLEHNVENILNET